MWVFNVDAKKKVNISTKKILPCSRLIVDKEEGEPGIAPPS